MTEDDPVAAFEAGIREGAYPGGQLAASREGERVALVAGGVLGPGLEATSRAAIYDLASLTKPLATTLLVGRALEAGKCALEDPISKHVPGADPKVTLEHLLEHSSGYPAHVRFDQRLPPRILPGSWDAWRHIVLDAGRTRRVTSPGARAEYSDIGFILLGAALEVVFARPLSKAFSELATPLFYRDLRGPPAPPVSRPNGPIAPTENGLVGLVHDENCRAMGGAAGHAGLWGTAEGVLEICEALLRAYHGARGELLAPETVRRLFTPSRVEGSTRTLGWDRPSKAGSSTGGRWPPSSVGHLGFTGTSVWLEPDRALAVVLVTNRVCPSRSNEGIRRVRPALHDAAWTAWGDRPIGRARAAPAGGGPRSSSGVTSAGPRLDETPTDPSASVAPNRASRPSACSFDGPTTPLEADPSARGGGVMASSPAEALRFGSGDTDDEPTTRLDTPHPRPAFGPKVDG